MVLIAGHAGAAAPEDHIPPRPFNYTSHSPAFMRTLLAGRVWVFRSEAVKPEYRSVGAYAFFPDGRLSKCMGRKLAPGIEGWRPSAPDARWWIERQSIGAMLSQEDASLKPGPFGTPMYYDTGTGALHTESNARKTNAARRWIVLGRGWLQEGWPMGFTGACPGLALPEDMKIETRQTVLDWQAMRDAAPDAIVRNVPGGELTSPGRTGFGTRNDGPTTTPDELLDWIARHEGLPVLHVSGRVMRIGAADRGGARPLAILSGGRAGEEGRIALQEDGGIFIRIPGFRSELVRPGYPLPFLPLPADGAGSEPHTGSSGPKSGTARCAGGYEGAATWTLGEDGKKIWDTSGCRKADGG